MTEKYQLARPSMASDAPLDYATAIKNNLWGWRWASLAARLGALASSEQLPPPWEAEAARFALIFGAFAPGMRAAVRRQADQLTKQAIQAYEATVPLLDAARLAGACPGDPGWKALDEPMALAEWLGRSAARAQRTIALMSVVSGGVR